MCLRDINERHNYFSEVTFKLTCSKHHFLLCIKKMTTLIHYDDNYLILLEYKPCRKSKNCNIYERHFWNQSSIICLYYINLSTYFSSLWFKFQCSLFFLFVMKYIFIFLSVLFFFDFFLIFKITFKNCAFLGTYILKSDNED